MYVYVIILFFILYTVYNSIYDINTINLFFHT